MLPVKRDRKWFIMMLPAIALALALFILIASSRLLDFTPGRFDFIVAVSLALVGAVAICGFGYAGLKFAFACSALGVVSGLSYMSHIFMNGDMELKGLVGLLSGAELAFIFFLVGINGQMVIHVIKKRRTAK